MFHPPCMFGTVACFIAIGVTGVTRILRGRFAALILTIILAATVALADPPFLSFRVERNTDMLALLLQSIVGLGIALPLHRKSRQSCAERIIPEAQLTPRLSGHSSSLRAVVDEVVTHDFELERTITDLHIQDNIDGLVLPGTLVRQIISDVLRHAFSHGRAHKVSVYLQRRHSVDTVIKILINAAPETEAPLPRLYWIGRPDNECDTFEAPHWPPHCSATWFDNGHEYIYQISIRSVPPHRHSSFKSAEARFVTMTPQNRSHYARITPAM